LLLLDDPLHDRFCLLLLLLPALDHCSTFPRLVEIVGTTPTDASLNAVEIRPQGRDSLAAAAQVEDLGLTLYHLARAVEESALLGQPINRRRRAAILRAIEAAVAIP
jgi:hypothetical protein